MTESVEARLRPTTITTFSQVHKYLRQFYDVKHSQEYKLDNMLRLMDYLDNPQEKFRALHVAGTSGKTSTAYYLSALLTASGHKTGLTVSPYVDEINERVQINTKPLGEDTFCKALSEFSGLIALAPVKPSWFELMVAFAYWYFAKEGVEYAVIEVGLGGLKDGTNVINRADKVCVITDIGYDHMNILGRTLPEISAQKAGIIHPGNQVFTYEQTPEIINVIKEHCRDANLHIVEESALEDNDKSIADYQKRNWHLAEQVYAYLTSQVGTNLPNLTRQVLDQTKHIVVPGRMDIRKVGDKTVIMDGAHNLQKMKAFTESFRKLYPGVRPAFLLAMKEDKDYMEVLSLISRLSSRVVTTSFQAAQDAPIKSIDADELARAMVSMGVPAKSVTDKNEALNELLNGPEGVLIITGSLYLISQMRDSKFLLSYNSYY